MDTDAPRAGRPASKGTRDRILDAAAAVLARLGMARATTKEIARTAGLSEATLYKHFRDKDDLLMIVLRERLPPFLTLLGDLPSRAGHGSMTETLEEVARTASAFYDDAMPMMAGLFAEQDLLSRHRDAQRTTGRGPHLGNRALARYVRGEQHAGRIAPGASPDAIAALLLGACFQRAFYRHLIGEHAIQVNPERFARDLVRTLAGPIFTV